MNFAERNAELVAKYAQANAEVMTAWFSASAKFVSIGLGGQTVNASDAELTRLNSALENRMAIDREMIALIQDAFASGGKSLS